MSGVVHLHRKVVVSLILGYLSTYLLCEFRSYAKRRKILHDFIKNSMEEAVDQAMELTMTRETLSSLSLLLLICYFLKLPL